MITKCFSCLSETPSISKDVHQYIFIDTFFKNHSFIWKPNLSIFGTPFTMLSWFVNALHSVYYFTHRKGKSSFRDKFSRLNWTFSWEATGSGLFVNKSSKSSQKADILKTAEDINTILVTDYSLNNIRANVSNNTNKLKSILFHKWLLTSDVFTEE